MLAGLAALALYFFADSLVCELISHSTLYNHTFFDTLNHLISTKLHGALWVGLFLLSKSPCNRKTAIQVILSLCVMIVATYALKTTIGRARPFTDPELLTFNPFTLNNSHHSTPSSHAACIFISFMGLSQLWPRYKNPLLATAALLSTSRLFTGHHYPSDLAAGYLIAHYAFTWRYLASIPLPERLRRYFPQ